MTDPVDGAMNNHETKITPSGGNVFEDIGLSSPELRLEIADLKIENAQLQAKVIELEGDREKAVDVAVGWCQKWTEQCARIARLEQERDGALNDFNRSTFRAADLSKALAAAGISVADDPCHGYLITNERDSFGMAECRRLQMELSEQGSECASLRERISRLETQLAGARGLFQEMVHADESGELRESFPRLTALAALTPEAPKVPRHIVRVDSQGHASVDPKELLQQPGVRETIKRLRAWAPPQSRIARLEEKLAEARENTVKILSAIEQYCGDEFSEDLDCRAALCPEKMDETLKQAANRLSEIYVIAHAYNTSHSCYDAHASWRTLDTAPEAHPTPLPADPDTPEPGHHTERLQQPQQDSDDNHHVQDRLDALLHRDVGIHDPEKQTNDDQRDHETD